MVQRTKNKVVMTSNAAATRKQARSVKGVKYQQLDTSSDEDVDTVHFERETVPVHGKKGTKATKTRQTGITDNASTAASSFTNHQYELEMSELRSRKERAYNGGTTTNEEDIDQDTFIEVDIQDGDTLPNVALKFGCKVAELKRLNNLIKDQDFYALQRLKVPAKRHGYIFELAQQEEVERIKARNYTMNGNVTSDLEANEDEGNSDCECPDLLVRTVSIRDAVRSQSVAAQKFLQKMDKDIHGIVESTRTRLNSLEEVKEYLTAKRIQPLRKTPQAFSVAEFCGIRWWNILIVMLVVGLLIPVLYFIYFEFSASS